jgi:hypothetical protein
MENLTTVTWFLNLNDTLGIMQLIFFMVFAII